MYGQAPRYLADHLNISQPLTSLLGFVCVLQTDTISSYLAVNTYGRRAFSIAGQTVWNSLPDELRDPACSPDSFKQFLTTTFLVSTDVTSTLKVLLNDMRYIQSTDISVFLSLIILCYSTCYRLFFNPLCPVRHRCKMFCYVFLLKFKQHVF